MMTNILALVVSLALFGGAVSGEGSENVNPSVLLRKHGVVPIPLDFALAAPVPSPDDAYLAFTRDNFQGLYLFERETGNVRQISDLNGSGFGFAWSSAGLLAFRGTLGNLNPKHVIGVAHTDGVVEVASPLLEDLSLPQWGGENLYVAHWGPKPRLLAVGPPNRAPFQATVFCHPSGRPVFFDGDLRPAERGGVSGGETVFFLPRLSKDADAFLLHGLDGHIYLGRTAERTLTDIGEGSGARFARDGDYVIYERTADDGHQIIASDLFLYEIASRTTYRLTDTPDVIERNPAMASDGVTVFWEEGGKIMEGWLP